MSNALLASFFLDFGMPVYEEESEFVIRNLKGRKICGTPFEVESVPRKKYKINCESVWSI
jgi:hypothetical protein